MKKRFGAWLLIVALLSCCIVFSFPAPKVAAYETATGSNGVFATSLEADQRPSDYTSNVLSSNNVSGWIPSISPECYDRIGPPSHIGVRSILFSGSANAPSGNANITFLLFDVQMPIAASTTLSYWLYPENDHARYVGVDLGFTDGTWLRDLGAQDQNGIYLHPYYGHGGNIPINAWTLITSKIGTWAAGKTANKIILYYYRDNAPAGQFRGFVDDISIAPFGGSGFETDQPQPDWNNQVIASSNTSANALSVTANEQKNTGSRAVRVSGQAAGGTVTQTTFRMIGTRMPVDSTTTLSYWLYADNDLSRYLAIDLHCTDGTLLSQTAAVDRQGVSLKASAGHGSGFGVRAWKEFRSDIGRWLAGKTIDEIRLTFDRAGGSGPYLGWLDDLSIMSGVDNVDYRKFQFEDGLISGQSLDDVTWVSNQVYSGNVSGYYAGLNPECWVDNSQGQYLPGAIMSTGTALSASHSWCNFRALAVNIPITSKTVLNFDFKPVLHPLSRYVSLDLHFTDGTWLSDLGATDQNNISLHPTAGHGGAIPLDQWTHFTCQAGRWAAGKVADRIDIRMDAINQQAGQWRSFIDNIVIQDLDTLFIKRFCQIPYVLDITQSNGMNTHIGAFQRRGHIADLNVPGSSVSLDFNAPYAGTWRLRLRYAGQGSRKLVLNGTTLNNAFQFPSAGRWKGSSEIVVTLRAGKNNLTVLYDAAAGNNGQISLDELRVGQRATPAIVPGIAPTQVGSDDVIVYDVKVTDYGITPNSDSDATGAFQQALDTVSDLGGGIVFAPAGRYRFNGVLQTFDNVALRGEWKNPDQGGLGQGTILCVYAGKGDERAPAFITSRSIVRDLTIWYPEQSPTAISSYPYAIESYRIMGNNCSYSNLTFINAYKAISNVCAPHGSSMVRDIYGTILKMGFVDDEAYDVGRYERMSFDTSYWMNSGLPGAPTTTAARAALNQFARANGIGVLINRSDWPMLTQISMKNLNVGLWITAANPGMAYITTDQVNVGVKLTRSSPTGSKWSYPTNVMIAYSSLRAGVGTNPICLDYSHGSNETYYQALSVNLSNTTLGGTPHTAIRMAGVLSDKMMLNLNNCVFEDWGYQGGIYAIDSQRGALNIEKSTFLQNKKAIRFASSSRGGLVLANTFTGTPQIDNLSGNTVIDHTALDIPVAPDYQYDFAPIRKPANPTNFYNVRNAPFNASGKGNIDDTAAIQAALNAAGNAGGGTVYVPFGQYRINGTLNVPAGVELRGTGDAWHTWGGSYLELYANRDNPNGPAAITLGANAGIRGMSVVNATSGDYPWAIRGAGSNCYVRNVSPTATRFVDMMTNRCDGAIIADCLGMVFKQGIQIGKGIDGGWVQDNHFNPGMDYNHLANGVSFLFGYCRNVRVMQNFDIVTKIGHHFISESGGSFSGTVLQSWIDGCQYGYVFEGNGQIDMINIEIVANQSVAGSVPYAFRTMNGFSGRVNVYGGNAWGKSNVCEVNGGTLNLIQFITSDAFNHNVLSGSMNIYGASLCHPDPASTQTDYYIGPNATSAVVRGSAGRGFTRWNNQAGSRFREDHNLLVY